MNSCRLLGPCCRRRRLSCVCVWRRVYFSNVRTIRIAYLDVDIEVRLRTVVIIKISPGPVPAVYYFVHTFQKMFLLWIDRVCFSYVEVVHVNVAPFTI